MHVCLFDIDGTLLASGGAGQAAMEAAIQEEFSASEIQADIPYAGRTDRGITEDIFRHFGLRLTEEARQRFLQGYLKHLPVHLGKKSGLILPGVETLLEHLTQRHDVVVGLLTGNLLQGARVKLEHFGLDRYFDFSLGGFGDEHLDRNDVAKAAWEAVRQGHELGSRFELERVWVIGDTPADVRCGRSIGAKTLAVATGIYTMEELEAEQPDVLVADFSDADRILQLWL